MLFFVPGNAFGWLMPAGSLGAAVTLLIILIAAGRGGFSPHRMLLAGMALSTAFTMLLMMLQASGDPRMAKILTWISGSTYGATGSQVIGSGIVMIVLLAMVPLCRRWLTILPLGGETARAVGMALTPARGAAAAGRVPDGDGHHDDWPAEFCGVNGAAYRQNDGVPPDDAAYRDVGPDGRGDAGVCGLVRKNGAVPVSDPGGAAVDLYRCAVLYLSVEKAESVIRCGLMPSPTGRGRTP
jgi:iron complex transport system permease protein